MDEQNTNGLEALKTAIDALTARIDQLADKQQSFEEKITNEVLNPANEAYEKSERDKRFNDFKDKYGEKLSPFESDVKTLEGDDFDLYSSTFDAMDGDDSINPDEFIDNVTSALKAKIDDIKSKLGIAPDAEVTVTETPDGDVEVKADGETVVEESTDTETKVEETTEEPKTDEDTEETTSEPASEDSAESDSDDDEESEEDEEEEFRKLMEEIDNYKE